MTKLVLQQLHDLSLNALDALDVLAPRLEGTDPLRIEDHPTVRLQVARTGYTVNDASVYRDQRAALRDLTGSIENAGTVFGWYRSNPHIIVRHPPPLRFEWERNV